MSRIPNGLGELKNRLESHIWTQRLTALEKCGEAALSDPKVYVQTVLGVHKKYNALVVTVFNRDGGFVAALDKACRRFIKLPAHLVRWMAAFILNREQRVKIGDAVSRPG